MSEAPVIAVDGPSGSGKGTLCFRIARQLQWHLLDSGSMYRLVALAARQRGIPLDDEAAVGRLAASLDASFELGDADEPFRITLDGVPVGDALRTEECAAGASRVASLPAVRNALLARQRQFRRPPGLVADGRDMGTVVFPDATVKLFITASPEARAERRYKQLLGKGIAANVSGLLADIAARDARDQGRAVSPLKPASDAVVIDTTGMDIDSVFERVVNILAERGLIV